VSQRSRAYGLLVLAVVLVVGGTLAAGFLPSGLPYQALAGGIIVLGFGVGYWCVAAYDIWE
jgi:hypothetical protein